MNTHIEYKFCESCQVETQFNKNGCRTCAEIRRGVELRSWECKSTNEKLRDLQLRLSRIERYP